MFGNPKGELRICPNCKREHDILRGTACICACGRSIMSKEYDKEKMMKCLNYFVEEED